jgi:hypothetical protein
MAGSLKSEIIVMKKSAGNREARSHAKTQRTPELNARSCFVLMPFEPRYQEVFDHAIKPAALSCSYACSRADELLHAGNIVNDIVSSIAQADIVIADLTGRNPNVFYELGIAHTLGVPCILLSQNLADVPFDLRSYRTVVYKQDSMGGGPALVSALKEAIRSTSRSKLSNPVWDALQAGPGIAKSLNLKGVFWRLPFGELSMHIAGHHGASLLKLLPSGITNVIKAEVENFLRAMIPSDALRVEWVAQRFLGEWNAETQTQSVDVDYLCKGWPSYLDSVTLQIELDEPLRSLTLVIRPDEDGDQQSLSASLRETVRVIWLERMAAQRDRIWRLAQTAFGQRLCSSTLEDSPELLIDRPKRVELAWRWNEPDRG